MGVISLYFALGVIRTFLGHAPSPGKRRGLTLVLPQSNRRTIVSGLYDVQLDELRPQFGLEWQKKNRAPPPDRTFLTAPCLFHPVHSSWQSRRCSMGWCFLPPLQPLPRPCIHACAHLRAIIGTAAVCFTSHAQFHCCRTMASWWNRLDMLLAPTAWRRTIFVRGSTSCGPGSTSRH